MTAIDSLPPRSAWLRAFTALPADAVQVAAEEYARGLRVEHRRVPRAGLAMLNMTEGNFGEQFLLGEVPVATASVSLTAADGRRADGAAQVMHDDEGLATALAVLDALLAGDLPGSEHAAELLRQGQARRQVEDTERAGLLRATRVDFSRLEVSEDDDDD